MKNATEHPLALRRNGQDSYTPDAEKESMKALDPSLWNSAIGRRKFVKRTGAATAGTVIALNGLVFEVLASDSVDGWQVRAKPVDTSDPNPEISTGTPFYEGTVLRRFKRTTTITSDPSAGPGQWNTSATCKIKVTVEISEQYYEDNEWKTDTEAASFNSTYERTVTANINSSGDVTFVYNDGKSSTHVENGITITLSPSATGQGAVTASGPVGGSPAYNLPQDTMDAAAPFEKRHGTGDPQAP